MREEKYINIKFLFQFNILRELKQLLKQENIHVNKKDLNDVIC